MNKIINFAGDILMSASATTEAATAEELANQITAPIFTLVNIILAVIAAIGVIMLTKSVPDLANAIQQHDNTTMYQAGRSIAAAMLFIFAAAIIKLFYPGL